MMGIQLRRHAAILAVLAGLWPATAAATADQLAELTLVIEYEDQCPRVGQMAAGRTAEVGGVRVSLEPLFVGACDYLKEQITASIQARMDSIQGQFQAALRAPVDELYRDFKLWLAQAAYDRLPPDIKAKYAFGTDAWNDYYATWLDNPDAELALYVNTYLKERFPRIKALLDRYHSDSSMQIVEGLQTLYGDAKTRLQNLFDANREIEANPDTPYADILAKYGITGPWLERFKQYEGRFNVFNDRYNLVAAGQTLYGALQAERGRDKIAGMFTLLSQVGDVAYRSDIPGVSLFGQIIKAYGDVAQELLKQVNALEHAIRQREGYCIGLATHSMEDPRNRAFVGAFGDGTLVCPLDEKRPLFKDIYEEVEGDTPGRLYFWDGKAFVAGAVDGGGVAGVRQAMRLIEAAATAGPRYAGLKGKSLDPATVAGVYNTPYEDPEYGRGIPGLRREAAATFDGIERQLRRLSGALERVGSNACPEDALNDFLRQDVGLRVEVGGLDEEGRARTLSIADEVDRLRPSYAMGYVARHGKVPGLGSGGGAYDTYSEIWKKLEPLSMLLLRGRVRDAARAAERCPRCAGAEIAASVTQGRELPRCEVDKADDGGNFVLHVMTRSQDVAVRLSARAEGRQSEPIEAGRAAMDTPPPPFVHGFDVTLRIPFEDEDEADEEPDEPGGEPGLAEAEAIAAELEALAAAAEGTAETVEQACEAGREAAESVEAALAGLDSERGELDAAIEAWQERASGVGDADKRAGELARSAEAGAKGVGKARKNTEKSALRACEKLEAMRSARDDAGRDSLLDQVRAALDAAEGHRSDGAQELGSTRTAAQDAQTVLASLPELQPGPEELSRRAADLRQRLETLDKETGEAVSEAVKRAEAAVKDLEKLPRRADDLLARGLEAIDPEAAADAARDMEDRLRAAHTRVAAATQDPGACIADTKAAGARAAARVDEAAAAFKETEAAARKAASSDAGKKASRVSESVAQAQASRDVAEVFQEAADAVIDDARRCLDLAEDLLRQVAEDREDALAEAERTCPRDKPGSVAAWDAKANAPVCRCPDDRIEAQDGAACVDPGEFTDWAQAQCAREFRNSALEKSDPRKGTYRCACPDGYEWNGDRTACVDVGRFVAEARELCAKNYPNSVLVDYDIQDGEYRCNCPDGFVWSGDETWCVDVNDYTRRAAAACRDVDPQAVVAEVDPANDRYACTCRDGFLWDGDRCVNRNAVIAAAQRGCASQWPGSQLVNVVQVSPLRYECNCPPGTVWNGNRTACVGAPQISPQDARDAMQAIQGLIDAFGSGGGTGGGTRPPRNCHRNPQTGQWHCGGN